MGKRLCVAVDTANIDQRTGKKLNLVRPVSPDYLTRTFGELLEKACDEEPDDYMPDGFPADQIDLVHRVRGLYERACRDPSSVGLYAVTNDANNTRVPIKLSENIGDYVQKILMKGEYETNGEVQSYEAINLYCNTSVHGGVN